MEEWKKIKISDIGHVVTGKTPRTSIKENYGGYIPFLTPSDDLSNKFAPITNKVLTDKGLMEVRNCLLPENSICVSCIGSDLGKVVMLKKPTVTNQQFNSIIPNENYSPDFVYYLMIIVGKRLNFLSKTSTAVPIINKSTFSNFEVEVPSSLRNQTQIAKILSSLDDKIELNNRINANLEEQAQTLFHRWFVDFEFPNEQGLPYKSNGGKFIDSELGRIPKEWKVGTLSDIANIIMGQSPSGESYNENGEGKVFYQGRTDFGNRFPSRRLFTTEPKRMAEEKSVLLSVRAPVGDINIAIEKCCIGRGLASIRAKNDFYSFLLYTMFNLKDKLNLFNGEGTVFGSINKTSLESIHIVKPNLLTVQSFEFLIKDFDRQIKRNYYEIVSLEQLRDVLLPKLMNNEIKL